MNDLIKIIELQAIDLPEFKEIRGKDYVSYGVNNLFPQKLIELSQKSAIHSTALQSKLDAVIGQGIAEYGELIVNSKGDTLNDIYKKIAYDYILFGGFSLNVIWNKGRDKVAEIYHLAFNKVRSGKLNDEDVVDYYYYSSNWNNTRKYVPKAYRSFNPTENKGDDASQIYYYYDYCPGVDVYPLPDYMGALNDIELDSRVSVFHNANISNGMSPGLFINFPNGEPTLDERNKLYKDLTNTFAGEKNAGRVFVTFSEGSELKPEVTTIDSANDDYYIVLEQRISSRILTAHRITSGMLVGIKDNVGLGNNAEEIETAYIHFLSAVIKPIQIPLNKGLEKVMKFFDPNITITVIPNKIDFKTNIIE